jgi:serine/threonine protein kinase
MSGEDVVNLKPLFDQFWRRLDSWGRIWSGSWFFGLAIRPASSSELRLVLGKLILRTPGLSRPSIRAGHFLHVPGLASGLMRDLGAAETDSLVSALSENAIPSSLQTEFGAEVSLPESDGVRWNLRTEETVRGDQFPAARLERIVTKALHELVGFENVQRAVAALKAPGVHIDGFKELAEALRWSNVYADTAPQMVFPSFEITAPLPIRLLSFDFDESRSAYVARVRAGSSVPRDKGAISLLGALRDGRPLTDFREVGQDPDGLLVLETLFPSSRLRNAVKATLFFAQEEVEELTAVASQDSLIQPFASMPERKTAMANNSLDSVRAQLEKTGWHLPQTPKKLGGGGGGDVYQCFPYELVDAIELGIRDVVSSAALGSPSTRTPRDAMSDIVDRVYGHLLAAEDAIGVVKIPHKPDARLAREIASMRAVSHPNFIRLYAADAQEPPGWFVMQYHPGGPIHKRANEYGGNVLETLQRIRPVVAAVSALHKTGRVHRDIKPNNIFVALDGRWILGDLGVVFERESERLTIAAGDEEFWSRDWRPDWVAHRKHEDYQPAVDVFMLAKTLYYMVSGGQKVAASQIDEPEYSLSVNYPDEPAVAALDEFFAHHIVTKQLKCASQDAQALGERIDQLIRDLDGPGPALLFQLLSTHSSTDLAKEQLGPDPLGIVVIGQRIRRVFARARMRVGSKKTLNLTFQLREARGSGYGPSNKVDLPGPTKLSVGLWTGEDMVLSPEHGIMPGVYQVHVEPPAGMDSSDALTGLAIYGW